MKKLMTVFCMILTMVFGTSMGVFAAETPTVTFDGSEELKYNYSDTANFGDAFVGILPGDERTQEIILENTSDRAMDFYMEVEVLRALEEATQASDAAYQFSLSVTQEGVNGGEPQMIYGGGAESQAWIGGDKEGLANINEVLEQYGERGLKVATLEPGQQAVISLSAMLDGMTGGNTYQDVQGTFQFAFHASDDTPDPVTEEVKGKDKVVKKTVKEADKTVVRKVKTGDPTALLPVLALLGVSVLVILVVLFINKNKKKSKM